MSVNLYDQSLLQKLKYWTEKTDVTIYGVDDSRRLIEVLANKTDDKSIKLPIISIRRTGGFTIKNPNKKPMTFDGLSMTSSSSNEFNYMKSKYVNHEIDLNTYNKWLSENKEKLQAEKTNILNAVPIMIRYYVDVYTRYQKENDLYMRNIIFNCINYPTFQIQFNYNSVPIIHNSNIILGESVDSESPTIRLFQDQICKQTLTITIDDAYLWDMRVMSNIQLIENGSCIQIKDESGFITEHI